MNVLNSFKREKSPNSSELWEHFHQVFANNVQQQFVSCNECKTLLAFTSVNGTNNLKTHLKSCSTIKTKPNGLNQTTVHEFFYLKHIFNSYEKVVFC